VLEWYKNTSHKQQLYFVAFDIVVFYPSIDANLMTLALDYASNYTRISDEDRQIILHAKKTVLVNEGEHWAKKANADLFDIGMGSYDGAESCELVGLFLLNEINHKYKHSFGLYRDDGLGMVRATPRETENIKKGLCSIFKKYNLKITIEANKTIVNFLDVTLNLRQETYKPFNKPNNFPRYVHKDYNHPPQVIKNIPKSVNNRLSSISSDIASFAQSATVYQEALHKSGYTHELQYTPVSTKTIPATKKRRRHITWYNPPYSANVATNIGRKFLHLIDREFPKNHVLHKIFNRNTMKVSYSCTRSIGTIIDSHNKKLIASSADQANTNQRPCNCRRNECPMNGKCLEKSIIYQATVTTTANNHSETYIGLTENSFKTRFNNHNTSFRHRDKRTSTELSNYIWDTKDKGLDHNIAWRIVCHARPYSNITGRCNLCLTEKLFIMLHSDMSSLNKRQELVSTCRHARKYLLANHPT
jgi:hypothetical protein